MFCISLEPKHLKFIKSLNYIPVGVGEKNFSEEWMTDNKGKNISKKNKNYGEYTFHYWIWKNYLDKLSDNWIGFCQYRKFWTLKNLEKSKLDIKILPSIALKEIPKEYEDYEAILGNSFYINQRRTMKFLKKGFKLIIKNPKILFSQKSRNIKFHFDIWHGSKYMEKAIALLEQEERNDFNDFVNLKVSFNPHNMFICKSKNILEDYYNIVFPWLERCHKLFGFENLKGFGKIRIYTFLAERFLSYWFKKNYKFKTMPIVFYDIRKDFNKI